ncbi:DUF6491 family protein [Sphingomonas sp.]|uniref:DUF6491 family protein n=1 Tax=Sphingomonas sp. TaxID=28214 RepID=UPI00286C1D36|nr:DUF6491 family protein [Sphingomonas sp.]
MKMILPLLALPLIAGCNAYAQTPGATGAQSTAAARPGGQCFYANNVTGFRQGPGDTIIVNTNSRDYYELKTLSYCAGRLDFEHQITLRARAGGFICSGYDAEIYIPDALGPTYCPVRANRKLTPDEVATLRATRKK